MNRLNALINDNKEKITFGGKVDFDTRYISPTVMRDITIEDSIMNEEIFGPILPIIKYSTDEDIRNYLLVHKKPLALYVFSEDRKFSEGIINKYSFGGGCVNDTISHVASKYLPFGGIGTSGIGSYHGKKSFDTFTHEKSIVKKSTNINIDLVFPPYKNRVNLIKKIMK